jgi:hypothetical protein
MTTPTPSPASGPWAARMLRRTLSLAAWTAAWVGSLALASFAPDRLWPAASAATAVAIGASVLVGIGMLVANKRHLLGLDELQRALQLDAMAWSLGAGLVAGMAWVLLDQHELIGLEANIAHLTIFMALAYVTALLVGFRRYL